MKWFFILSACVGLLFLLVGPIRERAGRWLSSSETFHTSKPSASAVREGRPAGLRSPSAPSTPRAADGARIGEQTEDIQTAIQEYRLRSAKRVKQVQRALKQAGFDPGSIDGLIGHRTHTALIEFQKTHHLEPDGVLGVKTWEALRAYLPTAEATAVDAQ